MAVEEAGNSEGRAPSPAKRKRTVAFAADETTDTSSRPPTKRARLAADLSISRPDDRKALETVESKYDVQIHSIVSSTKIQKKVASVLRHLQEPETTVPENAPGRPRIVVLRGPAAVAGKLVSIAEIAKREIAAQENGHWFQYIALGQYIKESPRERPAVVEETILDGRNAASKDDSARGSDDKEDEDDEDDDFEYMKTPFERAFEGKPRKHAVAVMSLFLARVPVDELKRRFGEQNNTTSAQTKT
ncbi:hypothetical protein LQW54_002805 [Pestalotiopsis sp. IQ-011]